MYPFLRFAGELIKFRNKPLGLFDAHISTHRCLPWDIDPWLELNNGRTLTIFDLGRVPFFVRTGAINVIREKKWRVTVAGTCARYRRRITTLEKVTMISRFIGWDDKFFYIDQSMWKQNGECANQLLVRSAIVGENGIVSPKAMADAIGHKGPSPQLPAWVTNWIDAEETRPWPPAHSPLAL